MLAIDVQGYCIGNKFIPKELATFDGEQLAHFVFKPPFHIDYLHVNERQQVRWLEKYYHGLKWEDGFTSLDELPKILEKIQQGKDIYCKGILKYNMLKEYLPGIKVYPNDEEFSLRKFTIKPKCSHHFLPVSRCALNNVKYIYKFINKL